MKLMEFQGQKLFAQCGIKIPVGKLLSSAQAAGDLQAPLVLKAQVMTGGRGKAGGIRLVGNQSEITGQLNELFSMTIKGEKAAYVLAVEGGTEIQRELYLCVTTRGSKGQPIVIASGTGGIEIENIAKADPAKIVVEDIDPETGVTSYLSRRIADKMGCGEINELHQVITGLYELFVRFDAKLVEINPLAVTPNGLIALDAKVVLDDNARYRHAKLFDELEREQGESAERHREDTITFVGLKGDVALISDGAGTGMLSLDMVHAEGGELASFCELGGVTNADVMYTAMKETMDYQGGAKCLLVVLIGGFNRMDHMAEGILRYKAEHDFSIPVVVRMCGTMEETGKEMLSAAEISTIDDLGEAVEQAVRLAKEA